MSPSIAEMYPVDARAIVTAIVEGAVPGEAGSALRVRAEQDASAEHLDDIMSLLRAIGRFLVEHGHRAVWLDLYRHLADPAVCGLLPDEWEPGDAEWPPDAELRFLDAKTD